ncbi:unnamed protein product [Brassicogethes aeneus]|uniref:Protein Wnt n=1 Tax=Brassicogethes aeneus TaxID=1431903 RepID=A0A9P0B029_BRAAE|nr:unnamed protein product [Brassicogethes aeneus]
MRRLDAELVLVVVLLATLQLTCTNADWWSLGLQSSISNNVDPHIPHKERCSKLEYLIDSQKRLCSQHEKILPILAYSAKLAIDECQNQFKFSRWNCTSFPEKNTTFGNVVTIRSREAAYLSAVSAASVAFAVTKACSKGELSDCSCETNKRLRKNQKWKWGGCSEDIRYGQDFSKKFLDIREDGNTAVGLMNLHNIEAGRRAVRTRMTRVCKCHGVSGSCSMQICWRKLPNFKLVGEGLFQRYEGSSHVKFVDKRRRKLRIINPDFKKPNKTDLVFLDDSPDYCEKNDTLNILGTRGRECNRMSQGIDGCRLLCCGRGYQTRVREVEDKCKCAFVWCCSVKCDICRSRREEHVCN